MKVVLESELEKQVWEIMMETHEKWEKNHGRTLQDMMERYFNEVYKDEIEAVVKREVERRLMKLWGEEEYNMVNLSEDEYVARALENTNSLSEDELKELEDKLRDDYRAIREDLEGYRESLKYDVEKELHGIYYSFFNAPENLTVIYNGEVIQGGDNGREQCC